MAVLTLRQRQTIHRKLSPIVGDEETEAMLAQFPATPEQEPVTVAALDARLAELRASIIQWTVGALIGGLSIGMGVAAWISDSGGPPGG